MTWIINITTVQYDLNFEIKCIKKKIKTSPIGLGRKSTFRSQCRAKNYLCILCSLIIYYTFYIVVNREGRGDIYPSQRGTLSTAEGVGGRCEHSAQQSMTGGELWAWGELSEYEWQIPAVPLMVAQAQMGGKGTLSTGEPSEYDIGIASTR